MTSPTLILGSGFGALSTAKQLLVSGQPVVLVNSKDHFDGMDSARIDRITSKAEEILLESDLVECRGQAGGFEVAFSQKGQRMRRQVACIVVATAAARRPNLQLYDLKPSASVMTLSEFSLRWDTQVQSDQPRTIAWINGVAEENSPLIFEEMLRCAMRSQKAGHVRNCFITANLKVAGNGLEALHREAKAGGISFFKLDRGGELKISQNDGPPTLAFDDASTAETLSLSPDWVVVDETVVSSEHTRILAEVLHIHIGPAGFLQTENVHRLPVYTNRQGILAVGSARGVMTDAAVAADAAAAAAVINRPSAGNAIVEMSAVIDTGACIRCLTCFRICPHVAVEKGHRMAVVPAACEACGLCVVECPRRAIELESTGLDAEVIENTPTDAVTEPAVVVMGCRQSAIPALETARERNLPLPHNLVVVEVPCTGGVSLQLILDAFVKGAQGVMVMGCHTGNCRSEIGSDYCRRRIDMLARQLPALGVSETRLSMRTIAANMAADAVRIVREFAEKVKK